MNNKNKGVFLQEFYGVEKIPALKTKEGTPTKFAQAAKYWGESIPTTKEEVAQLVKLGISLQNDVIVSEETLIVEETKVDNKLSSSWYSGTQELSTLTSNLIKVPFVKKGSWKHDVYGKVEFTDKDITELVQNYKNNVTGFTPYLTLGHLDEELNSTDSHRKRGNLQDIVVEGDTTFGIFKVSNEVYARVKKGEYEYSSGEFHRKFKDKNSGKEVGTTVLRVALTNSPFLPFGADKVQTLSNELEGCPETKENYVFLLSLDTSNSDNKSKDNDDTKQLVEELSPVEKENTSNIPLNTDKPHFKENITVNNKSTMSIENNVTKSEVETLEVSKEVVNPPAKLDITETDSKESVKTVVQEDQKVNQNDAILSNLTAQFQKVQEVYSKQLEAANATIDALTGKVDILTDKLVGQEKVTQAFSNSMSQAQENAVIQNLQNNGVLPTNIQRFLTLKNAFQNAENKNVVKFSVSVGEEVKEVEKNVIDAVAELLIAASNQTPLVEQQLGVSAGRRTGGFDFSSIIEKNQAAAKKLNSK